MDFLLQWSKFRFPFKYALIGPFTIVAIGILSRPLRGLPLSRTSPYHINKEPDIFRFGNFQSEVLIGQAKLRPPHHSDTVPPERTSQHFYIVHPFDEHVA